MGKTLFSELAACFSPSGGVVWHWRALRLRRQWAEFNGNIALWLNQWEHRCTGLLLLGPSAGWCLPDSFLCRFPSIHAVDTDPLAPALFGLVHGRALASSGGKVSWERADICMALERLLEAFPGHALLFCNMLGQHALHRPEAGLAEAEIAALGRRLKGRQWASFHDRLSGLWAANRPVPQAFILDATEEAMPLAKRVNAAGEWRDHLTTRVLPSSGARLLLPWRIRPGRLHWIEAGCVG